MSESKYVMARDVKVGNVVWVGSGENKQMGTVKSVELVGRAWCRIDVDGIQKPFRRCELVEVVSDEAPTTTSPSTWEKRYEVCQDDGPQSVVSDDEVLCE